MGFLVYAALCAVIGFIILFIWYVYNAEFRKSGSGPRKVKSDKGPTYINCCRGFRQLDKTELVRDANGGVTETKLFLKDLDEGLDAEPLCVPGKFEDFFSSEDPHAVRTVWNEVGLGNERVKDLARKLADSQKRIRVLEQNDKMWEKKFDSRVEAEAQRLATVASSKAGDKPAWKK